MPSSAILCIASREQCLTYLAVSRNGLLDLIVGNGIDTAEAEVFEFTTNFAHAEAVCDTRIDLESLFGDLLLALRIEVLEGPHIVETISELDKDDPDVVHHREHHFA